MDYMFYKASNFDQNLNNWDMSNVITYDSIIEFLIKLSENM